MRLHPPGGVARSGILTPEIVSPVALTVPGGPKCQVLFYSVADGRASVLRHRMFASCRSQASRLRTGIDRLGVTKRDVTAHSSARRVAQK